MIILEKQEHEIYAKKEKKITEFYHPEKIVYCYIFGIFNVF